MLFQIGCNNALKNIKRIKTSTFKWMLNNIVIKKIISVPIWATKLFFEVSALLDMLDTIPSCNLVQYQGKLMLQPWENFKNPNFGPSLGPPIFLWVLPLQVVRQCSRLSSYAISRKTNEPNLKKWQKTLILGPILGYFAQIWTPNIFCVFYIY